jgi:hypothetical protein
MLRNASWRVFIEVLLRGTNAVGRNLNTETSYGCIRYAN